MKASGEEGSTEQMGGADYWENFGQELKDIEYEFA